MNKTTTSSKDHLREARALISQLTRACRQTLVYLGGQSCMNETTVKQMLQKVIRSGENYENTELQ